MAKHAYQVVISNVGTVYDGSERLVAEEFYYDYVNASEHHAQGTRVAGEDVTLFADGEPVKEHLGRGGLRNEWIERVERSKHRRKGH